jgi:hypothetical protein
MFIRPSQQLYYSHKLALRAMGYQKPTSPQPVPTRQTTAERRIARLIALLVCEEQRACIPNDGLPYRPKRSSRDNGWGRRLATLHQSLLDGGVDHYSEI